jgi:trehalose-phosphatase
MNDSEELQALLVPHFYLPVTVTFSPRNLTSPQVIEIPTDALVPDKEKIAITPDATPTFRTGGWIAANNLRRLSMPPGGFPAQQSAPLTPTGGGWALPASTTEDDQAYFFPRNVSPVQSEHADEWTFSERQGYSALYAGIASLKNVVQVGWIGKVYNASGDLVPFVDIPRESLDNLKEMLWRERKMVPVFLSDQIASGAYEGFCKSNLHPLLHYILNEIDFDGAAEKAHWKYYQAANVAFAQVCLELINDESHLLIQDYHLCLLPNLLREKRANCKIGMILHAPWPSSEIFRSCARRVELLEGILGADLVGFHTYSYARHFMSSCSRILGVESTGRGVDIGDRVVSVHCFPIGIDVHRAIANQAQKDVQETMQMLRELYKDKIVIVGRERLDQVEGVEHKMNAYSKFLELFFPVYQNRVVLIQVTTPPQKASPKLESRLSELITRVNSRFGNLHWTPVLHYHTHIEQADYYALLSIADVCLITSIRDGMNITSHEYVVCQRENMGVLILSEFTGSASSLSAASMINPYDYLQVAHAMNEALQMSSEEKKIRHTLLLERIMKQTAQFWAKSCLDELLLLVHTPDHFGPTPLVRIPNLIQDYRTAQRRLCILDYDGTLTAIRRVPSAALPSKKMLDALKTLADDPKNTIFVVSGRDQVTLEGWLGELDIGLSAEHGCFLRYPHTYEWFNLVHGVDDSWKDEVMKIFQYYEERTEGSFIEQKRHAITWHYRLSDETFGSLQAKEALHHLEASIIPRLPVSVLVGKKNLEVRPIGINKGKILERLWTEASGKFDFILCVGDDVTDEDTFKAAQQCDVPYLYTIVIGDATKRTKATGRLASPQALIQILERLGRT